MMNYHLKMARALKLKRDKKRVLMMRVVCTIFFIGMFFVSITFFTSTNDRETVINHGDDPINSFDYLPCLFNDLKNEGIVKRGDKLLFILNNKEEDAFYHSHIITKDIKIDFVSSNDLKHQNIKKKNYDLVFTHSYTTSEFMERVVKEGGVIIQSGSPSFDKQSNYKTVYARQFDEETVVVRRKTSKVSTHRRLLNSKEAREKALSKLEDVLLEPPRAASRRSRKYLKRTKYLPDLMGDSLESYPRRVFIDVGLPTKEGGSGTGWFEKNYPTRNRDFEIYKIETVTEGLPQVAEIGMSNWLKNNVKHDEYVVMKAEAELVDEMMKSEAIKLVDELFLECKPRKNGSRMAYWQCLALYGRLRDEGVAVHQWWG